MRGKTFSRALVSILHFLFKQKRPLRWAVVVAQLVERSLPTQEILGSNPIIGNSFTIKCIKTVLKRRKLSKRGR